MKTKLVVIISSKGNSSNKQSTDYLDRANLFVERVLLIIFAIKSFSSSIKVLKIVGRKEI